jgi:hypothetical protein
VVAVLPDSTRKERTDLLGHEIEELVVEAKRLGIGQDEMLASIAAHWQRLSGEEPTRVDQEHPATQPESATGDGGRTEP